MCSVFARGNYVNARLPYLVWDGRQKAPRGDCRKAPKGALRANRLNYLFQNLLSFDSSRNIISGLTDSVDWAPEGHEAECVVEDAPSVEERGGEAEELFTLHLHPSEEATLGEPLLGEHVVLPKRENGHERGPGNRTYGRI